MHRLSLSGEKASYFPSLFTFIYQISPAVKPIIFLLIPRDFIPLARTWDLISSDHLPSVAANKGPLFLSSHQRVYCLHSPEGLAK